MKRAVYLLMLPAFVIVVLCAAAASRAERIIDEHPYGGPLGAIFFISAFCVAVGGAELLGAWLS